MNYLPFKTKGGPELYIALKTLPAPYKNGWIGDSPCSYYKFNITDLRLEQGNCNEIKISPEEFVSKVNSFIRASAFACKGSPELAQFLDTYREAGLKDLQNDPCISSNKCYFIWENQLFSRPCSKTSSIETVSIELFRTYWNSKFGISHKSFIEEKPTVIDKNKTFVRGGKETEKVLCTLLNLGLLKTFVDVKHFSEEDHYFALGSMCKDRLTWTYDRNFYLNQGLTEITPSEVRALWLPKTPEACSAHINMESPKNSKPFGLSQKQTLKIVL